MSTRGNNATDSAEITPDSMLMDDLLLLLARVIVITLGALYCDEVLGLLVLLLVALTLPDWGARRAQDARETRRISRCEKSGGGHGHMISREFP